MSAPERTIAVVGGGLTGLVAAYTLRHNPPHPRVILYESSDRLGGRIETGRCGDATVEFGADSFLTRDPVVIDLCRELGIVEELVRPAIFGAQIWTGGELHPLPLGFLRGVPSSLRAALNAEVLSKRGALRTVADLMWPTRLRGKDVSFGRFVRKRFGKEVHDKLISSVLAGTRAGIPEEISLAAAAPEIDAIARKHRSVMRGLEQIRKEGKLESGPPPFRSLHGGMSRLIERLTEHLGSVDMRMRTAVEAIERDADGYHVVAGSRRESVAGVAITAPPQASAAMLRGIATAAADGLGKIRHASVAAITLVYPPGSLDLPLGSGLLVPANEERLLSACTWFSRKWPHLSPPDGSEVVRAFVGRAGRSRLLDRSDEELIAEAHWDLEQMIGASQLPRDACVRRWNDALPQYDIGHLDLVAQIDAGLAGHPIAVAGAGLRGSGIPDCVTQGQRAARSLVDATLGSIR